MIIAYEKIKIERTVSLSIPEVYYNISLWITMFGNLILGTNNANFLTEKQTGNI